jgi:uncharacterized membrane protein
MTGDPATWPIGIAPIVWFAYGVVQLAGILFLGKEPTRDTLGAFMGFVPGVVVIIAWLVGYRNPSDHTLWKFLALSCLGAAVWIPLRFQILQNSKFGEKLQSEIQSLGPYKLKRNLLRAAGVFLLVFVIFGLGEPWLQNPVPCTRIMCETGARILGSQFSSLGFLWFFSFFTATAPIGVIVTLSALVRSKRN